MCCKEINNESTTFTSTHSGETFQIRHHMTCKTPYVIYLIECCCNRQYIGRTTQPLHKRINKHRANIHNKFLLYGLSRHCTVDHPDAKKPFKITPIDHINISAHDRFEKLKKRKVYWIYKMKTL